jgi:signal peptidase I
MSETLKRDRDSFNASGPTGRGRPSRGRRLLRGVEHFLAVIGICFVIYHLCFEVGVMTSGSMAPTLSGNSYEEGDRLLIEKLSGRFREPSRWEVYFFYNDDGIAVAKRIVGLPGERVSIRDNQICINGRPIQPPKELSRLKYYPYGNLGSGREVNCERGYFVLGDDSVDSYDSRFVGPVLRERFRGRVWCILLPAAHAGFVR